MGVSLPRGEVVSPGEVGWLVVGFIMGSADELTRQNCWVHLLEI